MKRNLVIALLAVFCAAGTVETAHAQGFLKKLGKALDKVAAKDDKAAGKAVTQANGVVVQNPMINFFDIELVGAYGVSKSENFGDVELVLKVAAKAPITSINIGGNTNFYHSIAYDADGNTYKPHYANIGQSYDITEGIAVRIVHGKGFQFENVRKSVTVLPMIKLGINGKGWEDGEVTFKNVPVAWDAEH